MLVVVGHQGHPQRERRRGNEKVTIFEKRTSAPQIGLDVADGLAFSMCWRTASRPRSQ